jgi:hypothetical protein
VKSAFQVLYTKNVERYDYFLLLLLFHLGAYSACSNTEIDILFVYDVHVRTLLSLRVPIVLLVYLTPYLGHSSTTRQKRNGPILNIR